MGNVVLNPDRIYQGDDELWYFKVRGNTSQGPFVSYHAAEAELTEFVERKEARLAGRIGWPRRSGPARQSRAREPVSRNA